MFVYIYIYTYASRIRRETLQEVALYTHVICTYIYVYIYILYTCFIALNVVLLCPVRLYYLVWLVPVFCLRVFDHLLPAVCVC